MKSENLKETISELNRVLKCSSLRILETPCPDDSSPREFLKYNGTSFIEVSEKEPAEYIGIFFILESPHTDEYEKDGSPIEAANGGTGQNFNKSLIDVLNLLQFNGVSYKTNSIYGVSIVNAIQYQTSLGYNTSYYRSAIFQLIWKYGGKDDFETRLKSLVKMEDTIIINACTKGNDIIYSNDKDPTFRNAKKVLESFDLSSIEMIAAKINLNMIVHKAITPNIDKNQYKRIIHPTRWIKLVVE